MPGPSERTIKQLFAVSGIMCAFTRCREPLVENGLVVGELCHIKGEKPRSARYDTGQSDTERLIFDNIILLCRKHHKIIDDDRAKYTVAVLLRMKAEHEARQSTSFSISDRTARSLALLRVVPHLGRLLHR